MLVRASPRGWWVTLGYAGLRRHRAQRPRVRSFRFGNTLSSLRRDQVWGNLLGLSTRAFAGRAERGDIAERLVLLHRERAPAIQRRTSRIPTGGRWFAISVGCQKDVAVLSGFLFLR